MFFNFGPLLYKFEIDEDFRKELLDRGRKTTIDYRDQLAGHLDKENQYEDKDLRWFAEKFTPYLTNYVNSYNSYIEQREPKKDLLRIKNLWINFMKAGDFNPPHIHSGELSFVIYLQVPELIKLENAENISNDFGPGSVVFTYGETQDYVLSERAFMPNERDAFIFNAKLRHHVSPFKSNVERISVSGNVMWDKE